jgi:hypothetical protein
MADEPETVSEDDDVEPEEHDDDGDDFELHVVVRP